MPVNRGGGSLQNTMNMKILGMPLWIVGVAVIGAGFIFVTWTKKNQTGSSSGLVTVTTPQGQQIQVPASQAAQYLNTGTPSGMIPASTLGDTLGMAQASNIAQTHPKATIGCNQTPAWCKNWFASRGQNMLLFGKVNGQIQNTGTVPVGTQVDVLGPAESFMWPSPNPPYTAIPTMFLPVSYLGKTAYVSAYDATLSGTTQTATGSLTNSSLNALQAGENVNTTIGGRRGGVGSRSNWILNSAHPGLKNGVRYPHYAAVGGPTPLGQLGTAAGVHPARLAAANAAALGIGGHKNPRRFNARPGHLVRIT